MYSILTPGVSSRWSLAYVVLVDYYVLRNLLVIGQTHFRYDDMRSGAQELFSALARLSS
jgi:hypothetical protein